MNINTKSKKLGIFCILIVLLGFTFSPCKIEHYDVLIKNTTIVDGTGKEAFKGSVAIKDEKIVAVGKVEGDAAVIIDGSGLVSCPGFIDPHSHADLTILNYPLAENLVMQGITTFVGGNCGLSMAPQKNLTFSQWLSNVEKQGMSINYAPLVGHNPIRNIVMGEDYKRKATASEVETMKAYVQEAMESGALGFSTFRDPLPSHFADIEEIIELVKVAQKYGGIFVPHTAHIQSQWPTDDPEEVQYGVYFGPPEDVFVGRYRGYLEAIEISRKTNTPVHIAHYITAFHIPQPHPDYLDEAAAKATVEIIAEARSSGIDVTYDVIACASSIAAEASLLDEFYKARTPEPLQWVKQMEKKEFIALLKTRELRDRIRRIYDRGRLKFGMVHTKVYPYWMNHFKILTCKNKQYEGKTIGEISGEKRVDSLETIFDILVEDPETTWAMFLDPRIADAVLSVFLKNPACMPCTDVLAFAAKPKGDEKIMGIEVVPPPIAYGLFPHYIGTFVREKRFLKLEEAIKKATSFPAKTFGLKDRGVLVPDAYADLVVFDFEKIKMKGNFRDPAQPPDGIEYVIVNGKVVYKDNTHTGKKSGKVIRRTKSL